MRVFVTGASGWIGSATVDELLAAGHEVTGLARSDASAATLEAKGVRRPARRPRRPRQPARGRRGRRGRHPPGQQARLRRTRRSRTRPSAPPCRPSATRSPVSGRPFLLASGVAGLSRGRPATEDDPSPFHGPDSPRGGAENLALDYVDRGVRTMSLRFAPTVHGVGDHGFIAAIAGVAAREGRLRLPRRRDQPLGGRPPLRRGAAGRAGPGEGARRRRLHAVAEEGVPTRQIAEAIGHALGLPVTSIDPDDVQDHFGWIGGFFAMDLTATSTRTRELLGWTPTGPTLSEDLAAGAYGTAVRA